MRAVDLINAPGDVIRLHHYERELRKWHGRKLDPRDPDFEEKPVLVDDADAGETDCFHLLANLPGWAIGVLVFLLLVVVPSVSIHFGPSEIAAARSTAAASNDLERPLP